MASSILREVRSGRMETPSSQLCVTTKLLVEQGLKPNRLPPQAELADPLAVWYADIFRFERRNCLLLFHPASGYGVVEPNVKKAAILNFQGVLANRLERSMRDDGFSPEGADRCARTVRDAELARTGDRSHRARMVQAVHNAEFGLYRSVRSDPESMASFARRMIDRGALGDGLPPATKLGRFLGEDVKSRSWIDAGWQDVCDLYVVIEGIEPRIWRRLVLPSNMRLDAVHILLQCAFGWEDRHLHLFEGGGKQYEDHRDNPDPIFADEEKVRLFDFLTMAGGVATYRYDYGDDWVHTVRLEARRQDDEGPVPRCEDGARAAPPEDVGGPGGYEAMMRAIRRGAGARYKEYRDWLPEGWDPEAFSAAATTRAMADLSREFMLGWH